jgi:hypothetical protein
VIASSVVLKLLEVLSFFFCVVFVSPFDALKISTLTKLWQSSQGSLFRSFRRYWSLSLRSSDVSSRSRYRRVLWFHLALFCLCASSQRCLSVSDSRFGGSMALLLSSARISGDLSVLVLGFLRGELSVCERLVIYSSLSARAFVRRGSSLSVAGETRLGMCLSVYDKAYADSALQTDSSAHV